MWAVVMHVSLMYLKLWIWQFKKLFHKNREIFDYLCAIYLLKQGYSLWCYFVSDTVMLERRRHGKKLFGFAKSWCFRSSWFKKQHNWFVQYSTSFESLPEHHSFSVTFSWFHAVLFRQMLKKLSIHFPPKAC
jgi:hypothetical protein